METEMLVEVVEVVKMVGVMAVVEVMEMGLRILWLAVWGKGWSLKYFS